VDDEDFVDEEDDAGAEVETAAFREGVLFYCDAVDYRFLYC
jgi:hypothetical protein